MYRVSALFHHGSPFPCARKIAYERVGAGGDPAAGNGTRNAEEIHFEGEHEEISHEGANAHLETGGDTQAEDRPEELFMEAEFTLFEAEEFIGALYKDQTENDRDRLRDDGGPGYAGHTHPEDNDKEQIASDIQKTGKDQELMKKRRKGAVSEGGS